MNEEERKLLQSIDQILQEPSVAKKIDQIADRVEAKFSSADEGLAWETIPLEIYKGKLPQSIRSSWVFLLKEGSSSGAERHPNSHQRVRSWRRMGDFQIWMEDHWQSHILVDDFHGQVEDRWESIPVNVWHQAVVSPGEHWIVVSFHTATADELIEERPDPADEKRMQRRVYKEVQS
jgi:hypothetical protein